MRDVVPGLVLAAGITLSGAACAQAWSNQFPRGDWSEDGGRRSTADWSNASDPAAAHEPDYARGYERSTPNWTDWSWMERGQRDIPDGMRLDPGADTLWPGRPAAVDDSQHYRFRGDPPAAEGGNRPPDSDLRFRPLTPREREHLEPTPRWRPPDEERRAIQPDVSRPATLFDTLTPDGQEPGTWNWPR